MSTVFISYRRDTAAGEARALFTDLVARLGKQSVFMDVDSISLGRDFRKVIQGILASCDLMLVIIDKDWARVANAAGKARLEDAGDYVRIEIEAALKRDIAVTPVLVGGAHMPSAEQLPSEIRDLVYRNGFEISHSRWESDVREMVRRLGLDLSEGGRNTEADHKSVRAEPGRPNRRQLAGAAAGAALILIGCGGYFLVQNTTEIRNPPQPEVEHGSESPSADWTTWMDQASYQREFDRQGQERRYPSQIEAKVNGKAVLYRARYEPVPSDDFVFFSRHSLDDEEFSTADAEYIQQGFRRVYQQRIVAESRAFNQATWTKP